VLLGKGLGKACALSLWKEGVEVFTNGRNEATVLATVTEIKNLTDNPVYGVVADITTDEGRKTLLQACPEADILVTNNAGPTQVSFWIGDMKDYLQAFESNMLAPVLMIRGVLAGMQARKFGRIVNITSAMVKSLYHIRDFLFSENGSHRSM
jgi:3-oxoacyl-[acyl-carrier protein] reductase